MQVLDERLERPIGRVWRRSYGLRMFRTADGHDGLPSVRNTRYSYSSLFAMIPYTQFTPDSSKWAVALSCFPCINLTTLIIFLMQTSSPRLRRPRGRVRKE